MVSRRHLEGIELAQCYPSHLLPLATFSRTLRVAAKEEVELNRALRVGVLLAMEEHGVSEANSRLFLDFTPERFLELFPGPPFAAGKLPHPRQMRAAGPAGDKDSPLAQENAHTDLESRRLRGRWHGE